MLLVAILGHCYIGILEDDENENENSNNTNGELFSADE
jgi:hypothetical protein